MREDLEWGGVKKKFKHEFFVAIPNYVKELFSSRVQQRNSFFRSVSSLVNEKNLVYGSHSTMFFLDGKGPAFSCQVLLWLMDTKMCYSSLLSPQGNTYGL